MTGRRIDMKGEHFVIEVLILLALVVTGVVMILATRQKKTKTQKSLHYLGIEILLVVAISFVPMLLEIEADFVIVMALILFGLICFKHCKK